MIVLRVVLGIKQHFGQRVTEWIMTGALLGWSYMLVVTPNTFNNSRAYAEIAKYGDETFWSLLCLFVAVVRLTALAINGTFKTFQHAAGIRAMASLLSCAFWGQITLGVWVGWVTTAAAGTGVMYNLTFTSIETWNLFRAWADVGAQRRRA